MPDEQTDQKPQTDQEPHTEQAPTGHMPPLRSRDELLAKLRRPSRPQPKTPPPGSWNRKGSGRTQTPRGNSRGR